MDRFERVRLHVFREEGDVGDARHLRILAPEVEKCVATINGQDRSGRTHEAGQLDRSVAKATTRINNLIALLHRQAREDRLTMEGQAIHQNVFPADKFWHQYVIPEFDVLAVLTHFSRESFNGHTTLRDRHRGPTAVTRSRLIALRPEGDHAPIQIATGYGLTSMSIGYGGLHATMAAGGIRLLTVGGAKIAR